MAPVTPTRTKSSGNSGRDQGGSGCRGRGGRGNYCRNNSIAKYSFKGKMKVGCISKLTITGTGHRAIQYKKIIDTLPVLCVDKNYRCIDDVLCTGTNLVKLISHRHIHTQTYGQTPIM